MTEFVEVKTAELSGKSLEWAVLQPSSDQPKTFACHHNKPTCMHCEWSVMRWLEKEMGPVVQVPVGYAKC